MMTLATNSPWLTLPSPNPKARLRLFCLPYAGGAATLFRAWPNMLPPDVEVVALQPPGRGTRLLEPAFTRLTALVEAAMEVIVPELDRPYAFFGHSMGAMLSFELARALRRERIAGPARLFVSGRRAPQTPSDEPPSYNLPDDEFIEELRQLNGTDQEVLEHPELMQLMLPLLRADFELVQTYEYKPEPPLDCPISAYGGLEDFEEGQETLEAWREQTTASFSLRMFPGDHFYLQKKGTQGLLLEALSRELDWML
jgi:medium-chain acyl-[acyl-carrier-protein] hydrolase